MRHNDEVVYVWEMPVFVGLSLIFQSSSCVCQTFRILFWEQEVGGSNPLAPNGGNALKQSVCSTFEFQLYGYGTPSHIVETMS